MKLTPVILMIISFSCTCTLYNEAKEKFEVTYNSIQTQMGKNFMITEEYFSENPKAFVQLIKSFPKGALLHVHWNAALSTYSLGKNGNCFIRNWNPFNSHAFLFNEYFPTQVFDTMGMLNNKNKMKSQTNIKQYTESILKELQKDNISYVDLRMGFVPKNVIVPKDIYVNYILTSIKGNSIRIHDTIDPNVIGQDWVGREDNTYRNSINMGHIYRKYAQVKQNLVLPPPLSIHWGEMIPLFISHNFDLTGHINGFISFLEKGEVKRVGHGLLAFQIMRELDSVPDFSSSIGSSVADRKIEDLLYDHASNTDNKVLNWFYYNSRNKYQFFEGLNALIRFYRLIYAHY